MGIIFCQINKTIKPIKNKFPPIFITQEWNGVKAIFKAKEQKIKKYEILTIELKKAKLLKETQKEESKIIEPTDWTKKYLIIKSLILFNFSFIKKTRKDILFNSNNNQINNQLFVEIEKKTDLIIKKIIELVNNNKISLSMNYEFISFDLAYSILINYY